MDLKISDLGLLVNQQNKEIINSLYDLVLTEFQLLPRGLHVGHFGNETSKKTLGTCAIYLSSLCELLHTTKKLLNNGFIESAGTVATSAWERTITLRMILTNPDDYSNILTEHVKAKKTPWDINQMLIEIVKKEHPYYTSEKMNEEVDLMYLQYTLLCTIKHGNPYTLSYLNRPDRSSVLELFAIKPNDCLEDQDLKLYLKFLVLDTALDTLVDFFDMYGTREKKNQLNDFRKHVTTIIMAVDLDVPKIFIASPNEYKPEQWKHFGDIDERYRAFKQQKYSR
jgi:hypothetical protein